MAITFTNLGASQTTATNPDIRISTNANSYSNSSWTPPTTGIIIADVVNWIAAVGNVPTGSGNSLTWAQIATVAVDPGTSHRITRFAAIATGSTTGVTTFDFAGQTQLGCVVSFYQAEGVDTTGGIASAFIQNPTNSGTGTSGSVTLAAAGHADNRPIACFSHQTQELATPDGAWTEVDDMSNSGPAIGVETQWDTDGFQNASASWATSSAWIAMASELKATVVSGEPFPAGHERNLVNTLLRM